MQSYLCATIFEDGNLSATVAEEKFKSVFDYRKWKTNNELAMQKEKETTTTALSRSLNSGI